MKASEQQDLKFLCKNLILYDQSYTVKIWEIEEHSCCTGLNKLRGVAIELIVNKS